MKTAILLIAAASVLAMIPGLAMAKDITGQLSQKQIDSYCSSSASAAGGSASFKLSHGKTLTGTVNCAAAVGSAVSAAAATDDAGMGAESANDADSSHEDAN